MGNPFDPGFGGATVGTAGAETGFWENAEAVYDQVFKVDSMTALQSEAQKRWEESVLAYQSRMGSTAEVPIDGSTVSRMLDDTIGESSFASRLTENVGRAYFGDAALDDKVTQAKAISADMALLNDPNIRTIEQILQDVVEMRQETNLRAADVGERADWLGTIGGFAGGAVGSFSGRDPLNQASIIAGSAGKTIAMRLAGEVAAGMATEAIVQEAAIQPTRAQLGEEQGNVLQQVLFAGGASGVLGLAGEGLGRLAERALRRSPAAEAAQLDFEDEQLRSMFEANQHDPRARAGLAALDDQRAFDAANPYGKTIEGEKRFTGELADIYDMLEGRTSTAVGRFLPEQDFTLENLDFLTQRVREDRPVVYQRWETANQALTDLDVQIAQVSSKVEGLSIMDAVGEVNAPRAAEIAEWQVRATEGTPKQQAFAQRKVEELSQGVWAPDPEIVARVGELEAKLGTPGVEVHGKIARGWAKELDQLLKKLDERPLEDAFDRLDNAGRTELAALQAQRVAVDREFRRSRSLMDREMKRIEAETKIVQQLGTVGPTTSSPRSINPQALRYDVVAKQAEVASAAEKALPDTTEIMVRDAIGEDGMITFGSQKIDPKFSLPDPGNPAKEITAGALMKEIDDDRLMVEAMKVCSA